MRRDLVIGIIVSVMVHGGVAWIGQASKEGPPKRKPQEEERVIEIKMPPIEPEEQEASDDTEKPIPIEFVPPMQNDVPQPTLDTSFVQPLQPPPPENMQIAKAQVIVPQGGTEWKAGIKIFDESQLDQSPIPTFKPPPIYPFEMRQNGISAHVNVELVVDSRGNVHDAFVENSTNPKFDENSITAIMKWKFKPGRKDGHAVNVRMVERFDFNLDD
jgi:periplasmic protein TonB